MWTPLLVNTHISGVPKLGASTMEFTVGWLERVVISCACCNIASWVSESVFLGDARTIKDSKIVDHGSLVIKRLVGVAGCPALLRSFTTGKTESPHEVSCTSYQVKWEYIQLKNLSLYF
jgi:hypothetical protein